MIFHIRGVVALALVFAVQDSYQNGTNDGGILQYRSEEYYRLSSPEECARQCFKRGIPKACYYQWTVEHFATLTKACTLCRSNRTDGLEPDCQCITSDGYETSSMMVVNRMYPGPSVMVCLNDYVIVDVKNRLPASEVTIHWHGMFQKYNAHYDGVPFVTQCPIHEGATFRYKFRADNSGTHFWHSHDGLQKVNGLAGALIVREPKCNEPYSYLWDVDALDNVIVLTDLLHDSAEVHFPGTVVRRPGQLPDSFLINGLGQWKDPVTGLTTESPLAEMRVQFGHRHRFRMINSCGFTCAVQITIEGHNITVIATDGMPIVPVLATSITSSSAERYDFVLTANKKPGQYWIQVRGLGNCSTMQQFAVLRYESAPKHPDFASLPQNMTLDSGIVLNALNVRCNDSASSKQFICIDQLESADDVPDEITKEDPDVQLYMPFGFYTYTIDEVFQPGTYYRYLFSSTPVAGVLNNISNTLPPSPFLSQPMDIEKNKLCSRKHIPAICQGPGICECYHVEKIPLNAVVEVILVDEAQIPGLSHPFHLHGHSFHVIGEARGADYNITSINVAQVKALDASGLLRRNQKKHVSKDTYAVPNNGYSIIRFKANNPGYWLFHCHFVYHLEVGMSVVFQVGERFDMPRNPRGFPTCANFVPSIWPIDDRTI